MVSFFSVVMLFFFKVQLTFHPKLIYVFCRYFTIFKVILYFYLTGNKAFYFIEIRFYMGIL